MDKLAQIRKSGFRPTAVGCFVNNGRVLLVFKQKHLLWQLPQGGIKTGETPTHALFREMEEELGQKFLAGQTLEAVFLGEDKIKFPFKKQNKSYQGKHYLIYSIQTTGPRLNINDSEFDKIKWLAYGQAIRFAKSINLPEKRRLTEKTLEMLKKAKLIR